jgi:peptidyl-prolyl cis-trans isomerase C
MCNRFRPWMLLAVVAVAGGSWVLAQQGPAPMLPPQGGPGALPAPAPVKPLPPPPANAVAATVNGQSLPEVAVYRAMGRAAGAPDLRKEVVNFLIDNLLVDQYLNALKIDVAKKEIDDRIEQLKKEAAEAKEDFKKIMENLHLTEDELRYQIHCDVRWTKFVQQQATDKALKEFFEKNPAMFDGSQMRARHILITPADGAGADDQAKARALALKKQIEEHVAKEVAQIPAQADNLTREKKRVEALEKAFLEAVKTSSCPSKEQGGDVGWFARAGAMVEPFARAAFALAPYQLSDVVATEFGYHLILPVERKAGKEVKFDDIKAFVLEVYQDRLRDAILTRVKPTATIVIHPAPKQ